ncbi:hypothetical protein JL107_18360 [Nakamurella flavida]|uniref:Uncharacterized protein n=1 Tax=Nakamurella flavida TaxID=363630 RepID=A0A938YLW6_9ACTN|nr:hypothetical protein [Nakamurella flavida]MBM9475923.1 hypothetical protein [Nakamurella flavida]MBM9478417.1 hypothetical protein [Nakamurella flavida]MDP9777791.1 hypothetical protein [Nakamurella flavida]
MAEPARRQVSVGALLAALIFLAVASVGFSGDPWWLFQSATKWIIAGVAALVGVGLLVSSLPSRRRG